jgi:ABC-type branched-subunit amino acid transport system ATPase component
MLELDAINASYDFLQVLWDVSLTVREDEFVALIGPNGAGKTTTLRTIAGLLKPSAGHIKYRGQQIQGLLPHEIHRLGISFVSETMNLFPSMSVYENLLLGAYTVPDKKAKLRSLDFVFELFPRLHERRNQMAGTLSGGERKMLALGRGLMSSPSLLLVDEPSLGLAPMLTASVFEALQTLHAKGMTILLVEQNVNSTLRITNRGYVLEHGRIVMQGPSAELKSNSYVQKAYLGV